MAEIRTAHLMTLTLAVAGMQAIGATPNGNRRTSLVRPDGATTLDVRLVLETDDKSLIGMTYRGMRQGPAAVMERLNRKRRPPEGPVYDVFEVL
jgi:Protein of unknown function (DUF3237)